MSMNHLTSFTLLMQILLLSSQAHALTAPADLPAMQELAKSLGTDKSLNWWKTTDPCKHWTGVFCDSIDNHVTAIQLSNRILAGILHESVRNLTGLVRLELQQNHLGGPLPSLAGLANLQVLLLHHNNFTSVPADFFAGLSGLQSAFLDDNPFEAWTLPESLKDAASLVNFSANSANVSGSLPEFLATAFPALEYLGLAFNKLAGPVPDVFAAAPFRSLWLNGQGLSGGIGFVENMTGLHQLWLQSNDFSGPLPDFSGLMNLQDLGLRDNQFTGPVPKSITELKLLRRVSLTNNLLQGPVPVFSNSIKVDMDLKTESFCLSKLGECDARIALLLNVAKAFGYPVRFAENWKGNEPCQWLGFSCDANGNITVINFRGMGLSGVMPPEFGSIISLQRLILSDNNLTGTIPVALAGLSSLKELDVSNNSLSGQVPKFSSNVIVKTAGNPKIARVIVSPPVSSPVSSGNSSRVKPAEASYSVEKSSSARVVVIVGLVIAAILVSSAVMLLVFFCYKNKQQSLCRVRSPNDALMNPRHSESEADMFKVTVAGANNNGPATSSETYSRTSSGPSDIHVVESGNMVISIQVLRNVTKNFSEENVLGRGGFGTVYMGELHDGSKIAVKRMEAGVVGNKGLNEFKSEIAALTKFRHRNLVSLLGYCLDGNERLLVYEYMPRGTLSFHLFDWKEQGLKPLEWKKRLSIALDVARGVEYLHNLAHQSFIHRDLKPSNILLGDDMKAKVADFGLVRLAPADGKCSIETRLAGTFGYLAPEYAVTGRVTTKVDIFSFGVILMELITGRKALDESQPEESVHLVTWFQRMQLNKDMFRKAIDPTINLDDETLANINTVAELAGHCCAREPYQRPDMNHTVNVLSSLVELWKPYDPDSEDNCGIDLDLTLPQALKKWQAYEDSYLMSEASPSFLASLDNSQTSIPTRPPGFADSFSSADGR